MVKSVYGEKEILLIATEYGMMTSHGKGQVVMGLTAPLMHKDRASRVQQELVQTMTMIFFASCTPDAKQIHAQTKQLKHRKVK